MILKSFSLFFRCSSWWSLIYLTKSIHNTTKGVKQQSTWDNFIISCGALLGVSQVVLLVHSCGFCLQGTCSLARLGNPSYRGDAASAICSKFEASLDTWDSIEAEIPRDNNKIYRLQKKTRQNMLRENKVTLLQVINFLCVWLIRLFARARNVVPWCRSCPE